MSSRCSGSETTAQPSDVVDADLLAVARVRVGQPVPGVLDLDLGEVLLRGAVEVHPAPGVEREVHRVRHAEQAEAQPVGVVPALAGVGGEEALGRGVGADDQRDLAEAGQDPGAGGVERLGAGRAGGVRRGDAGAVPAERLGEGGAGDVAAVPVAHGLAADDEVDVLPVDAGVGERGPGGVHAVGRRSCGPTCPRGACRPRGRRRRSCVGAHWSASCAELGHGLPAPDGARSPDSSVYSVSTTSSTSCADPQVGHAVAVGDLPQHDEPLAAARPRPARTARRARCAGRTAAVAGTARRCRTTPARAATAPPARTPRPRRQGCGRSSPPGPAGRTPCAQVVHRDPSSAGSAPVVNQPSMAGVACVIAPPK